jgi:hypothetical protein
LVLLKGPPEIQREKGRSRWQLKAAKWIDRAGRRDSIESIHGKLANCDLGGWNNDEKFRNFKL